MNGLTLLVGAAMIAGTAVAVYGWERWEVRRAEQAAEFLARLAAIPDLEVSGVSHGISAVRGGRGGGAVPDVRAIRPRTVTTDGPGWPHR